MAKPIRISTGDYLIVQASPKPALVKVVTEEKPYKCIREKHIIDGTNTVDTFSPSDVMVNLGKAPHYGTVYCVKVEPIHRKVSSKRWGEIRFFRSFTDDQHAQFSTELNTFARGLKAKSCLGVPCQIEVRPRQGKYAGMYKYNKSAEFDTLIVKPEDTMVDAQYILAHEYAHGIYFRWTPSRLKAKWIRLYHEYVVLTTVSEEDLKAIKEEIQTSGTVGAFMSDCADEDYLIVKACLKAIQQVHGISRNQLDVLMANGETLDDFWPVNTIELSEKEVAITEYARKSVEEFFAEAFAHDFVGRKMPAKVKKLLDFTMSKLVKTSAPVARSDDE